MTETPITPMEAAKQAVARFNQAHPVGAKVVVTIAGQQHQTETTSTAWAQGDATAVVRVKGYQNVFALSVISDPA